MDVLKEFRQKLNDRDLALKNLEEGMLEEYCPNEQELVDKYNNAEKILELYVLKLITGEC